MVILLLAIAYADAFAATEEKITSGSRQEEGLDTTTFNTPYGKLNVNLPDDLCAGDTLVGTVVAETAGATNDEIAKNDDELRGYVVEIKKAEDPTALDATALADTKRKPGAPPKSTCKDPEFSCFIPAAAKAVEICLTRNGKPVCSKVTKVAPSAPACVDEQSCVLPPISQCGHPSVVRTQTDGKPGSTKISVGGSECRILAKSPRAVVFRTPKTSVGPCEISVVDRDRSVRGTTCLVAVKLSASKPVLRKGEKAVLTVRVFGLDKAKGAAELRIENLTPGTVSVDGGNDQVVPLSVSKQ